MTPVEVAIRLNFQGPRQTLYLDNTVTTVLNIIPEALKRISIISLSVTSRVRNFKLCRTMKTPMETTCRLKIQRTRLRSMKWTLKLQHLRPVVVTRSSNLREWTLWNSQQETPDISTSLRKPQNDNASNHKSKKKIRAQFWLPVLPILIGVLRPVSPLR